MCFCDYTNCSTDKNKIGALLQDLTWRELFSFFVFTSCLWMPARIPVFPQHPVWLHCPTGHQQTWECVVYCPWPGTIFTSNWNLRCRAGDGIRRVTPPGPSAALLLMALDMEDREVGSSAFKQCKNCFFISEWSFTSSQRKYYRSLK